MKILIVSVVPGCSVDLLSEMVQKHNEHLNIEIFPFHAKRYSREDLRLFEEKAFDADLIDFEYWRGADVLIREFPWVKKKKKILTHHNPYDLDKIDPKLFDKVVVKNKTQQANLPGSIYIPHAVDMDLFPFNDNYAADSKLVGMVAYRIEGKKGIREVAQACRDLGYKFLLVGHISKPDYFKQIKEVGADFEFREDVPYDELYRSYCEMTTLVCNSVDNFESGTMPILEAMACGVPVLTRNIGLVPDLYEDDNVIVRGGTPDDVDDLKGQLKYLMENKDVRLKMREKGWQAAKGYNAYRMAKEYAKLYMDVLYPKRPLVSVVTATYNRREQIEQIIEALKRQTYKEIEFVVCDDNSDDGTEESVKSARNDAYFPIKYINTNKEGYNLAMARNLGVIEADGKFLVFLDSRLLPADNAIEKLITGLCRTEYKTKKEKIWVFGDKGASKKSFVENFSAIRRKYLIKSGMFNERVDRYGGMSQELRVRFLFQDFGFEYLPEAKATELLKASKSSSKKKDIMVMKDLLYKLGLQ